MWKEKFELRIDAHPEDGMQTVEISQDGDYWIIEGLDSEPVKLPNDDNVLAQIMDICQQIIDHVDNPLNFYLRKERNKAFVKAHCYSCDWDVYTDNLDDACYGCGEYGFLKEIPPDCNKDANHVEFC